MKLLWYRLKLFFFASYYEIEAENSHLKAENQYLRRMLSEMFNVGAND